MFPGCTAPPDSRETEPGSCNKDQNTATVLVLCRPWKCVPRAISGGMDIFAVPRCHWKFSVRVTKITSRMDVSRTYSLPFYFFFNSMNYDHINKSV